LRCRSASGPDTDLRHLGSMAANVQREAEST